MNRGKKNITLFPEGKAGYLEKENEIIFAADWEMPWACPGVMTAEG